ncbi:hypothetical protein PAXRUDRAFT_174861 [Paxillus rubicundulus Ve08.2h10]|uniref:HAT C-terminal dimerisation domain-containing protein n=1 Tax=Paxillus rubicundulus Ve08.2h10 TaxID=930991 RepID=A0A0D0D412_9AGAM|nr:hypothetical protein PAXRUDRAFT_174861 [Paxillus rubicundulus Ve08.2h10]
MTSCAHRQSTVTPTASQRPLYAILVELTPSLFFKQNIFDNLAALAPPGPINPHSKIDHYLSTDVEHGANPLTWWHECKVLYPHLPWMALHCLSIPATSVNVECLFSHDCILLSHI